MAKRVWDSLHPDTLYGDAAARVLCRMLRAEPSGRSLQQCLDMVPIQADPVAAVENGMNGDGRLTLSNGDIIGVECKSSLNGTPNVCWDRWEFSRSSVGIIAAWVPMTDEICWFALANEARSIAIWLETNETWLICRDRLGKLI